MVQKYIPACLSAAALILSGAARAYPGEQYANLAKLTLDQARATALKAQPGQITDQELEREAGGTGLRYSFDVKTTNGVHEVGVDAQTGAMLENILEGPHPD